MLLAVPWLQAGADAAPDQLPATPERPRSAGAARGTMSSGGLRARMQRASGVARSDAREGAWRRSVELRGSDAPPEASDEVEPPPTAGEGGNRAAEDAAERLRQAALLQIAAAALEVMGFQGPLRPALEAALVSAERSGLRTLRPSSSEPSSSSPPASPAASRPSVCSAANRPRDHPTHEPAAHQCLGGLGGREGRAGGRGPGRLPNWAQSTRRGAPRVEGP